MMCPTVEFSKSMMLLAPEVEGAKAERRGAQVATLALQMMHTRRCSATSMHRGDCMVWSREGRILSSRRLSGVQATQADLLSRRIRPFPRYFESGLRLERLETEKEREGVAWRAKPSRTRSRGVSAAQAFPSPSPPPTATGPSLSHYLYKSSHTEAPSFIPPLRPIVQTSGDGNHLCRGPRAVWNHVELAANESARPSRVFVVTTAKSDALLHFRAFHVQTVLRTGYLAKSTHRKPRELILPRRPHVTEKWHSYSRQDPTATTSDGRQNPTSTTTYPLTPSPSLANLIHPAEVPHRRDLVAGSQVDIADTAAPAHAQTVTAQPTPGSTHEVFNGPPGTVTPASIARTREGLVPYYAGNQMRCPAVPTVLITS